MTLTTIYIKERFNLYNKKYFNNELEMPLFEIITTKSALGKCCRRVKPTFNGKREFYYIIKVSNLYNRSEKEFDNTIIHEMIHLYAFQQFPNDSRKHGHGTYFKNWCNKINKDGWNLSRCASTQNNNINENLKKLKGKVYHAAIGKYNGKPFVSRICNTKTEHIKKWLLGDKRFTDLHFFNSNDYNYFEGLKASNTRLHYKFISHEEMIKLGKNCNMLN